MADDSGALPEEPPATANNPETSPEPAPTEAFPLQTPAPELISQQAALARALAALADRYLLEAGWEGGLTVQVELSGLDAEPSASPRYRVDLFGADGTQTGQVVLDACTGETLSMFFSGVQGDE